LFTPEFPDLAGTNAPFRLNFSRVVKLFVSGIDVAWLLTEIDPADRDRAFGLHIDAGQTGGLPPRKLSQFEVELACPPEIARNPSFFREPASIVGGLCSELIEQGFRVRRIGGVEAFVRVPPTDSL
jgi:hypothetical protein